MTAGQRKQWRNAAIAIVVAVCGAFGIAEGTGSNIAGPIFDLIVETTE